MLESYLEYLGKNIYPANSHILSYIFPKSLPASSKITVTSHISTTSIQKQTFHIQNVSIELRDFWLSIYPLEPQSVSNSELFWVSVSTQYFLSPYQPLWALVSLLNCCEAQWTLLSPNWLMYRSLWDSF